MTEALRQLREKYVRLAELRARREQGHPLLPEERRERKLAFRDIAARFPGALRELNGSPAAVLAAKVLALDVEIERSLRGEAVARWAVVVLDFHHTLRELLSEKRARPFAAPGGRIMNLVWSALAARHGLPREALQILVFGTPEQWPPDRRS
jgi:hypothetical protein